MTSATISPSTSRTLCFLFTDVEGSTRLWERFPVGMRESLARHDRILREAVEGVAGQVVKTTGDGVMAAFTTARDGLQACLRAQVALQREPWGETGPIRVRMGLHVGEGLGDGEDYHGQAVNRAARIMAAGHGGQVLLSGATASLVVDQLPEGASLRDLGEHHLKDLSRPERVFQLVHPDLPQAFAPIITLDVRARHLPAEPSAFVGRDEERARVVARLGEASVRLLTLTGPGGIGKTRLALNAAREVEPRFSAGAVFVDLSPARDTGAVVTAIARELELPDASEGAQLDELTSRLSRQQLLMILDNFEQVTATAPTLSQLLQDCPELKLLVTSREALHVRGEHLFPVPPMAMPAAGERARSAQEVSRFEAVQLFVDRARASVPDFAVTDDNAAMVADICQRLEGLPLAIELAAARLRVFSLESLRDRLSSRLRVLGSGARDLPERQQTLRATIEWSYQLLVPGEQRLFQVLSCFSGADVEAVEGVAGRLADSLGGIDPVDGLVSLVDKSLVRQSEGWAGEPRFGMLESIAEFAVERLEATPELAAAARAAHAEHYARWVAGAVPGLSGPRRGAVLDDLAGEVGNLRAGWRQAVAVGHLPHLEMLAGGLWPLHDARGWYRDLIALATDMLAVLEALPPSPERTLQAVTMRSSQARALSMMHGYTAEVEAAYERLIESLGGIEVPQVYPVLRAVASFYGFRSDYPRQLEVARQIVRLGEQQGDTAMLVEGHMLLGLALSFTGRLDAGLADLDEAIRSFETRPWQEARAALGPDPRVVCLTASSMLRWWRGELDRSLEHSERAVALAHSTGHAATIGYGLYHSALLRLWRGEAREALERARQVVEVAGGNDLHIWEAVGTVVAGAASVALGDPDEGLGWIDEGVDQYQGLRTPPVFWRFLLLLRAEAYARAGRPEPGLRHIDEGLALMPQLPDMHLVRGDLLALNGAAAEARAEHEQALAMARGWGSRTVELRAAMRLLRSAPPAEQEARRRDLDAVASTFTEGLDLADLVAARGLLAREAP